MKKFYDRISNAMTADEICGSLQAALDELGDIRYLKELPRSYTNISAASPQEIQKWRDKMLDDTQAGIGGHLIEISDLFGFTMIQLQRHGFHRS